MDDLMNMVTQMDAAIKTDGKSAETKTWWMDHWADEEKQDNERRGLTTRKGRIGPLNTSVRDWGRQFEQMQASRHGQRQPMNLRTCLLNM